MKYKSTQPIWFLLFALILLSPACTDETPEQPETPPPPPPIEDTQYPSYKVPAFSPDSAYTHVLKQVAFGPRVPGTEAHAACRDWLVSKFESYGLEVIKQSWEATAYDGKKMPATNIIAQYNPSARRRIVLSAHWDSRAFADSPLSNERRDEAIDGADDGASGVGVLLELGRLLQENPMDNFGVDLVLFDVEDQGESGGDDPSTWGLGSQYWSNNLHAPNYNPIYGILLDMIGSHTPRFTKDRVSMTYAPQVMNKIWRLAHSMGHGNLFVDIPTGAIFDDHYFVNTIAEIPMIDIINKPAGSETGFGSYWHTHDDNIDIISPETLGIVGQVMAAVIYREASGTL
ncbi:MAG: M28 family peptidase [Saprospiraceae bacterium]|nr:M28 family peptidase [Saprospiraceae bacterium]